MEFSEKIKALRVKLGFNQSQMADELGVSGGNYISQLESGSKNPSNILRVLVQKIEDGGLREEVKAIGSIPLHSSSRLTEEWQARKQATSKSVVREGNEPADLAGAPQLSDDDLLDSMFSLIGQFGELRKRLKQKDEAIADARSVNAELRLTLEQQDKKIASMMTEYEIVEEC